MKVIIRLQLHEVPEYLRDSTFYFTLRETDNVEEVFEVPAEKLKTDHENITTLAEFKHMIETLLFWNSPALPAALISFALDNSETVADLFHDEVLKLEQLRKLKAVMDSLDTGTNCAFVAARVGSKEIMQHCFPAPRKRLFKMFVLCKLAASGGNIECLKYAREKGCEWKADTCKAAAASGHLECLQYAHSHGCPWESDTCTAAAAGGHLECLQYAHSHGCPWESDTCTAAAASGHLECLQYAHSHGCDWDSDTCKAAAAEGHIGCLKYAHEQGCDWDSDTCTAAVAGGHIECLKYMHSCGFKFTKDTLQEALLGGHTDCVQYMYQHLHTDRSAIEYAMWKILDDMQLGKSTAQKRACFECIVGNYVQEYCSSKKSKLVSEA